LSISHYYMCAGEHKSREWRLHDYIAW